MTSGFCNDGITEESGILLLESSPPPPPPSSLSLSLSSASYQRNGENDIGHKIVNRPFLKKGSRKEPSSLNRRNRNDNAPKTNNDNSCSNSLPVRPPELLSDSEESRLRRRNDDPTSDDIVKQFFSNPIISSTTSKVDSSRGLDNQKSFSSQSSSPVKKGNTCKSNITPTSKTSNKTIESPISKAINDNNGNKNKLTIDLQNNQLKRMHKRQEIALVEAERIREAARSWSAVERASVTRWVNDQRTQIDKQRKQLKQDELLIQKASNERIIKKEKEMEFEALRATIEKMKLDEETKMKRFKSEERRLKMRNRKLEENIRNLQGHHHSHQHFLEEVTKAKHNPIEIQTQTTDMITQTDDLSVNDTIHKQGNFKEEHKAIAISNNFCDKGVFESDGNIDQLDVKDCSTVSSTEEVNIVDETQVPIVINVSTPTPERNANRTAFGCLEGSNELEHGEETQLWLNGVIDPPNNYYNEENKVHIDIGSGHSMEVQDNIAISRLNVVIDPNSPHSAIADRTEHSFPDGRKTVLYRNGTYKEFSPDGNQITIRYTNGDIQTSYEDRNVIVYFYAASNATQTSYADGLQVYEFHTNNQIEYHFLDGRKEIRMQNGSKRMIGNDGQVEIVMTNGVRMTQFTGQQCQNKTNSR